jgi:hypothetical protein
MIRTTVPRRTFVSTLVTLSSASVLTTAGLPSAAAAGAQTEWDGLELRNDGRVDRLFVRPGASLAGYERVRLERLQVSFDRNWDANRSRRGTQRLTNADFERIRNTLADEFGRTVTQELGRGGYQVVTEAGEDVLDVQPFIIDLFITAPGTRAPGTTWTFTADPGRMTLVAELRDSETQTILARAIDAQRAAGAGQFQITNNVTNMAAARQAITRWARLLRQALDAAEGKPAAAASSGGG